MRSKRGAGWCWRGGHERDFSWDHWGTFFVRCCSPLPSTSLWRFGRFFIYIYSGGNYTTVTGPGTTNKAFGISGSGHQVIRSSGWLWRSGLWLYKGHLHDAQWAIRNI